MQAFEGYGVRLVITPEQQPVTVQFEMEKDRVEDEPSTLADLYKHPSLFPNGTPDFE